MDIQLTPDQEEFIKRAIESGRFQTAEDAVRQALSIWEERERTRAEILAALDAAEGSLSHGEGRTITRQSMNDLGREIKQRGRNRLKTGPEPRR